MHDERIGIIAGSGCYDAIEIEQRKNKSVPTPYGPPSDQLILGRIQGQGVALLRRHGPGHSIPPDKINVRANIAALKHVGCSRLISLSAVGGLAESCYPGVFVLPDQFIDQTRARQGTTFFGTGLVGHVPFADPTCTNLRTAIASKAMELKVPVVDSGTYIVMEGPQFSTRAESRLYRSWGGAVIGMTAMPEAKLAREAELCYAMVAMVTDRDCHEETDVGVTADLVSNRMVNLSEQVQRLIGAVCRSFSQKSNSLLCECSNVLHRSIMTHPESWDAKTVADFSFVVPRLSKIGESK